MTRTYDVMESDHGRPIKMWTQGVPVEDGARAVSYTHLTLPTTPYV